MGKFQRYLKLLNESVSQEDISFYKKAIQKAIKEDQSREGHGNTGKTGFWILPDGNIVPYTKGWSEANNHKETISVHSHSSAEKIEGRSDDFFDTFSGGDIQAHQWLINHGKSPISILISRDGDMEILKGGNWKKSDFRYDNIPVKEQPDDLQGFVRNKLKDLAKERGATYLNGLSWKN